MSYKDLQNKAKKLGLKYVGVSEKDLVESIKEAEKETDKSPKKEWKEKTPKKSTKITENADAVVYHGKRKVRTYTLERHGKDYVKLAEQYISHPEREGYTIEFETVETRITCPHCGKKFRL